MLKTTTGKFAAAGMLALVAALSTTAAQGQQAPENAGDVFTIPDNITILGSTQLDNRRATAIVNGTLVTGTDVDQRVALILAASNATQVPPEEMQRLRLQVLRALIDEALQIQEARALEIEVTPEEIESAYARISTDRFSRSGPDMDRWLREVGSSPTALKKQIEGELAWDRILRRNVAPFVNVSSSEATEMHERLQASRGTTEYRIAEIFLPATPATQEAVKANSQRILDELRAGANFQAYARQYSQASTAAVGGDLGWIKLEQLQNPQMETVAREMQSGQIVGPIEIPGGFEILYMIDRRQVGMSDPRDSLLSLKQISLDFAAGTTPEAAQARATSFQQAVQRMRGCGDVDTIAAEIGAEVVQNDQIKARDLPEQLQPILLQLSLGQATPPFGSLEEGVRVLMLCGRDEPQMESGPDVAELMARLEDDRIQKRAQRYLRDLRRDAVIEYN